MRGVVCLALLAAGALAVGNSQPVNLPNGHDGRVAQDASASAQTTPAVPANLTDVQKQQVAAEVQRKNAMAADTAKLLQLANELKSEMDKSSKDMLSLSVVRKAAEIEKLAHKVREEMRSSLGN